MISVLLFSPGIDSLLSYYTLEKQGKTPTLLVYYAIGSRYTKAELYHLNELALPIKIETSLNLSDTEQDDAYIPNRNILMATHAAGKYNANIVYIGGTKSDRVSDNNEDVMNSLSETISESLEKPVKVTSPFWNKYKIDIAKEFVQDREKGSELLQGTFSCYSPYLKDNILSECNRCKACFRKSVILYSAAEIKRSFKTPHIIKKYKDEFKNLSSGDHTPRSLATMEYIEWLENRKR